MDTYNFDKNQIQHSLKSVWLSTFYFMLTFYYFGAVVLIQLVIYPSFEKVHENFSTYILVFNCLARTVLAYAPTLMLLSAVALLWFRPITFPKWTIWASIAVSFVSVIISPNFIGPVYISFATTGYTIAAYNKLLTLSTYLQIIPAAIQVIIAFCLLNKYLQDTKPFSRWTFLILFSFAYWTAGTGAIEGLVNYNLWLTVGEKDWLNFRNTGSALTFWVTFLLPAYLPLFALIAMFWKRPKAVPRVFVLIYALTYVWMVFITFYYFIPNIQLVLNKQYSASLIRELMAKDGLLRGLPGLPMAILPAWMLIKIGNQKINESDKLDTEIACEPTEGLVLLV